MYYQNEPGIYVYTYEKEFYAEWDIYGKRKINHVYYETLEDFFYRGCPGVRREFEAYFGYSVYDKICREPIETIWSSGHYGYRYVKNYVYCNKTNCREHDGPVNEVAVVYDHLGNFYSPDRLLGLYRARAAGRFRGYWYYPSGRKRRPWGGHRRFRTFHERKWAHAWDCEEYAPKVRAARQGHNLPDAWDDYNRHVEKSWKSQSKHRRQWRNKC